jgi:hypothetical protein
MMRRLPVSLGILTLLLSLAFSPGASAQGCGISLTVGTTQVNYPFDSVPQPGPINFGQIFDVNYSSTYANSTMALQYLDGSTWKTIGGFSANGIGFTEVGQGVDNSWAHFGTNSVRVQSGSCSSNVAKFEVSYDPSAAGVDASIYAALIALVVVFLIVGKKLGWKRFLVIAVPVYLALSPWTGQRYDVYFLLSSGIRVLQHVNPFDPGNPPVYPDPLKWAYPPLYPLYSAFSYLVYQGLTGLALPSALTWPGWSTSVYNVYLAFVPSTLPILAFLLKLPMIASAVLTGVILKKITGKESVAIMWVANPLIILVATIWGQLDPIATLLAVAAYYYFTRGLEGRAYLLASFGAAVKVWPVLVIPIMLVVSVRKNGLGALKPLAAVVPATVSTILIYASYGNLLNTLFVFLYARGIPTFSGAFTVNGLTWQEILFLTNSPPLPLFLVIGIPSYLAMLIWIYRKRDFDVSKWTIVSILIFFLTYNYVNPQYFYWVLPFLILQGRKISNLVFTCLPLTYTAFSYNLFYFVSPSLLLNQFALGPSVLEQLKVNFFYQTPWVFAFVSGLVPTVAYLLLLTSELRPDWHAFLSNRSSQP